jgi:hypothetical protein
VLVEQVALHYRVAGLRSSLAVAFSGAADPLCEPFDACGASGALAYSLAPYHDQLSLVGTRRVNTRVGRKQILADLRSGRLSLSGPDLPTRSSGLPVELGEKLAGPESCSDTVRPRGLLIEFGALSPFPRHPRALPTTLQTNGDGDVFRTHCPGPDTNDVLGGGQILARASLSFPELLRHRIRLSLVGRGSFSSGGYSGARHGALELSLTLVRVHAAVRREVVS